MTMTRLRLPRTIWTTLGAAGLLVLIQQQLLERRPPRLLSVESRGYSSGPGALDLHFSRPMRRSSLATGSRLEPPLPHRWLGDQALQRLLLLPGQPVTAPLQLSLSGVDQRGRRLPTQRWSWDPRPHLLVVARVAAGEQLQLRTHGGTWLPISPVWPRIAAVEPLADGHGVAFLAGDEQGRFQLWKRSLLPRSLVRGDAPTAAPLPGPLELLWSQPLGFAHMSSNRRGDLLLQLGGTIPGDERALWIDAQGRRHPLQLALSGPIRLLPEGEAMVVPSPAGLELRPLQAGPTATQVLPGSRELVAFCPATGQALLMRHWPDQRRSLERVQPGAAPLTLWIGQEAVMAASCDQSGDRIWMLLNRWQGSSRYSIVRLDARGRVLARRGLEPWLPEPGLPMSYDPVGDQLLLSVRRDPREPARAALLDARSLQLSILPQPIGQAYWLPAP